VTESVPETWCLIFQYVRVNKLIKCMSSVVIHLHKLVKHGDSHNAVDTARRKCRELAYRK
jgi:hypothetical protein